MNKVDLNRINICLSCDENYAQYAGVVIASILANSKADEDVFIYILDGNISESSKNKILSLKSIKDCSIEFVEVNEKDFEDYKKIPNHDYISISTYFRLKLATLLPEVDKIIYLDCDVIACESLRDLYNINLGENIFGGVLDIDLALRNNPKYVNAGVLLMDLDKVRQQNIENQFLEYTQNNWQNIQLGDQGVINDVLKGKILNIADKYNVQSECYLRRSTFTKAPVIVHFIGGRKPWHYASWSVHKYLYFKYLQMTPWKLSDKELFKWTTLNKFSSFISWFKHRPLFYLQSKFWNAVKKDHTAKDEPKTFVIILMACFGDILICNSLFQNIKRLYPNSRTVFVIDKPWLEAAKYQKDVDEVILFDKRGKNKGLFGLLSFIINFPYKKIDYIFKIYDNERTNILAQLLHPKKIVGKPYDTSVTIQERHNNLLKKITKSEIINYPITYIAKNDIPEKFRNIITEDKKYVALCPCSSRVEKDMPEQTAIELINKLHNSGLEVIVVGAGKEAPKYTQDLLNKGCKFINLVNKTSIYELAQVLRNCEALVSVDTGTMHFGYANNIPTVCMFYEKENIKYWAPNKKLYPNTITLASNVFALNIADSLIKLLEIDNEYRK